VISWGDARRPAGQNPAARAARSPYPNVPRVYVLQTAVTAGFRWVCVRQLLEHLLRHTEITQYCESLEVGSRQFVESDTLKRRETAGDLVVPARCGTDGT
jgi:hypothetical protein